MSRQGVAKEMEAGRELDALVAEKVMGWTRVKTLRPLYDEEFYISVSGPTVCVAGDLPHYSTWIAAAWEVVEKLAADGVYEMSVHRSGNEWWCRLSPMLVTSLYPSAPEAICRAALAHIEQS